MKQTQENNSKLSSGGNSEVKSGKKSTFSVSQGFSSVNSNGVPTVYSGGKAASKVKKTNSIGSDDPNAEKSYLLIKSQN